jgi:hypothetical protein
LVKRDFGDMGFAADAGGVLGEELFVGPMMIEEFLR